ncbi:MAG: dihydrodipicolinate synthase family protein [Gemmataceae bacterium]|nr:dihydrodipicolinate synthase family protein [Gemmataceae bacterium]MCS7269623.1 dihydrodipicolinate synthase family protein [Gemmataceae bacterium]
MGEPFDIRGLIPAVLTPLTADGELHLAMVERQAEFLRAEGVTAVFVGGTTGEFSSLSIEERLALASRWLEVGRAYGLAVLVHVGANCLKDSQLLAVNAQRQGAIGIALLSPHYFKPATPADLVACCRQVALAAPGTPFYFYHIPALTGVHFPLTEWIEQACEQIPHFAGVKFTHTDLLDFQLLLQAGQGRWRVFYGVDEQLLAAWVLGAQAAVGSSYNFATPLFRRILHSAEQGDLMTARQQQAQAARLIRRMLTMGYLAAAKELLRWRGLDLGPVRLPLRNLTAEQSAQFRHWIEQELLDVAPPLH